MTNKVEKIITNPAELSKLYKEIIIQFGLYLKGKSDIFPIYFIPAKSKRNILEAIRQYAVAYKLTLRQIDN